jgi:hypothetical protein
MPSNPVPSKVNVPGSGTTATKGNELVFAANSVVTLVLEPLTATVPDVTPEGAKPFVTVKSKVSALAIEPKASIRTAAATKPRTLFFMDPLPSSLTSN